MPVTLDVDHQQHITRVIVIGDITIEDIRLHLGEEGKRSGLGYRELIDASRATATFSSEDAQRIVEILKNLGGKGALGPTAIIVSDDLTYGMIRMIGSLLDGICDIRPFRITERRKAEEWLATAPIVAKKPDGNNTDA
jgi:hypothetical protein